MRRVPDLTESRRDLIVLARSYLWLGRAELQAGRPDAVPAIPYEAGRGPQALLGDTLLIGATVPQQSVALAQLKGHAEELTACRSRGDAVRADRRPCGGRSRPGGAGPRSNRSNPDHRFEVAWRLVQLAELLEQDGQVAEARSSLDEALPLLEALTKAEPDNLRYRHGLARAWETLGRVQARAGRKTEARDAATRAVALSEELARIDMAYFV